MQLALNPGRSQPLLYPALTHCGVMATPELQFENARPGVPITSVGGTSRVANVIPCLNSNPSTRSVIVMAVTQHAANVPYSPVMMTILRR